MGGEKPNHRSLVGKNPAQKATHTRVSRVSGTERLNHRAVVGEKMSFCVNHGPLPQMPDALPGGDEVNGALERIPTLRVRVLRDDVSNASSEADAARVVERALRQRPELGSVLVVSDYVK